MAKAPAHVRELFAEFLPLAEVVDISEESVALTDAYLRAGIVSPRRITDAVHVALATTAHCSIIVSWNFRHIVHFQKAPQYNLVNTLAGHSSIAIWAPPEVVQYEGEETV